MRGAIAHHYRARERPRISDEAWAAAPPIAKQAAIGATLLTINDYAQASADGRRLRARPRPGSPAAPKLDPKGWEQAAKACAKLVAELARSRRRPPSGSRRTRTRRAPPMPPS